MAASIRYGRLADGVRIRPLRTHAHDRGDLTEIYRASWSICPEPVQWNVVTSRPNVMRGMHVHLGYREYYVLLDGRCTLGYRDLRGGSPTEGATAVVEVAADPRCVITAPPGVAHGIYCPVPSVLLVGTTAEWDPRNELGCDWRDPELEIPWPFDDALLSERDAALPPLREILGRVPAWCAS